MQTDTQPAVTDPKLRYLCRHIFADGHRCGSPALRKEQFCYYHHITRRPKPRAGKFSHLDAQEPFDLPVVEDRDSALLVASQILSRIASNDLDTNRAGRLIAGLRVAVALLPREAPTAATQPFTPSPIIVDDPVLDEDHGSIAPIAELPDLSTLTFQPCIVTPPPREYSVEEEAYLKQTVRSLGYEPGTHARPISVTDADIIDRVNTRRRDFCLPPLKPTLDRSGAMISMHDCPEQHTVQPASWVVTTLQAVADPILPQPVDPAAPGERIFHAHPGRFGEVSDWTRLRRRRRKSLLYVSQSAGLSARTRASLYEADRRRRCQGGHRSLRCGRRASCRCAPPTGTT